MNGVNNIPLKYVTPYQEVANVIRLLTFWVFFAHLEFKNSSVKSIIKL